MLKDTELGLRGVCALCSELPRFVSLRSLALQRVGLDALSCKAVRMLASLAPSVRLRLG